jgi:hypothetical protein
MKALENLAEGLPKLDGYNHYENLKKFYAKSEWHGVHTYVEFVINRPKKKSRFLARIKKYLYL